MNAARKIFELALNTALKSDPETQQKLALFQDRIIAITIEDLKFTLFAVIDSGRIDLPAQSSQQADLIISATLFHLLGLARNPAQLFSDAVNIHGDVQFARQLQSVLQHFDFDWEAQLAAITGDTMAFPLAQLLRKTATWLTHTRQSLQHTAAEYLKEEIRILPDKSQINLFMNDVDRLRADLDRLEARIQRLQS